jgi:hypothetical protein
MSAPRVSVAMSAYNAAWCIERALDSVLAGTRVPDEILVCDDGSTDGTADLVESRYAAPVRVLRLPHRNSAATRSVGLAEATGDWLSFLDSDDSWAPTKLERQLAFVAEHPEVRWLCTDGWLFSAEGVVRESWLADYFQPVRTLHGDLFPPLLERCFPLMSSMLVHRDAYHAVGGLDTGLAYSHDYDLWLKVAARWPGAVLEERLVGYFTHPGQLSRRLEARFLEDLSIMRRVASGAMGRSAAERHVAAVRSAALEFDLAVGCFRSGRPREARVRMRRAAAAGPLTRRALALGAALAPGPLLPRLMRSDWIKRTVRTVKRAAPRLGARGREGKP